MDIDYLANHTDAVPLIAGWFYREWSYLYPERTLNDFETSVMERTNRERLPLALVALERKSVIGTVCLKVHDMDDHLHTSPWLAGLYVAKEWRGQGVGGKLAEAIETKAANLGFEKLYLYTPNSEGYYAKHGWCTTERPVYHGYPVSVMEKEIPRKSGAGFEVLSDI